MDHIGTCLLAFLTVFSKRGLRWYRRLRGRCSTLSAGHPQDTQPAGEEAQGGDPAHASSGELQIALQWIFRAGIRRRPIGCCVLRHLRVYQGCLGGTQRA